MRENTWGSNNYFGAAIGVVQVAGGIALTVGTGGFGVIIGSGLISSGINATIYSIKSDNGKLDANSYIKESIIGGASGIATGGIGALGGVGANFIMQYGIKAVGGMAGCVASETVGGIVYNREIKLTPSKLATGAINGAIGGAIGDKTNAVRSAVVKNAETVIEKAVIGGLVGVAGGAATGATTKVVQNFAKGESDLTKDIGQAIFIGASVQGAIGAAISTKPAKEENSPELEKENPVETSQEKPPESPNIPQDKNSGIYLRNFVSAKMNENINVFSEKLNTKHTAFFKPSPEPKKADLPNQNQKADNSNEPSPNTNLLIGSQVNNSEEETQKRRKSKIL